MASRSIWSGTLSFGLVNVPVKLYSATSEKNVKFNQLNKQTGARVSQKRVDASTGDEVAYENIVKGYELSKDRYVVIEPEELQGLAPKQTKSIQLEEFVDGEEIDPIYYGSSYYLAPDIASARAYRLLVETLEESGRVGIARLILRSKETLVALRVRNGVMMVSTMKFADEIVSESVASVDVETPEPSAAELKMAGQLIESLTTTFEPTKFRDEYREKVLELIERKAAGETIEAPVAEEETAPAPDLMAALQASLEAAGTPSKPKASKKARTTKKVAA